MLVSKSQTKKTAFVHENNIARSDSFPCEPGAPTLSSRPWFFSLLPAADIRRTEVSLNIFQRRLAKLIRYVGRLTPSSKDAAAVARAGRNLLAAAEQGNVDSVQEHIASNADINHAEEGMTALMHAAQNGHLDIIKVLITAGCSINQNGKDGKDALMLAAENGHAQVVDFLIRWGADVTRTESRGLTALTLAAYNGKTGVLQPFIDAGVAIDEPMKNGSTPLMFAAEAGHVEFVNALIHNGAEIDKENTKTKFRALVYAAKQGKIEVVKFLLEKGASVDAKGEEGATPLIEAASQGHIEVVKLLLKNCATVDARDAQGKTSLWYAAYKGHIEVVELLLTRGASVDAKNVQGNPPLIQAAIKGHFKVVELLLTKGASVDAKNVQGETSLMQASFNGHIKVVKLLLTKGASVDAKNVQGETPLMKASFNGHIIVVELLLGKGASVDDKNVRGENSLMKASFNGHIDAVKLLLKKGASVDAKNVQGKTPLMKASFNGHTEVVKLLLKNGATVDAKDAVGRTALVYTAQNSPYAALPILIENYANQYDGLLGVVQFGKREITKVIVRAWLQSRKNKLDPVTALACVFASKPRFAVDRNNSTYRVLEELANAGLTLTQKDFQRLILTADMEESSADYVKQIFVNRNNIPSESRIGNAFWSGNYALVDELINAPRITRCNPLGLRSYGIIRPLGQCLHTDVDGIFLHMISRFHDESPRLNWHYDVDPMVHEGWRGEVAAILRSARNEATEVSREISYLLFDPGRGFTLVDEVGRPVSAYDIRLLDTLFAFEIERNEALNQLADLPATESMSGTQKEHQKVCKAQAKALLASNKTYKRLKLNMTALAAAKNVEKNVRSGHLSCAEAVVRLDELMSETEKTYFKAPGITSELAYHWFISEVGEVCESLKAMRDKFKRLAPADMI